MKKQNLCPKCGNIVATEYEFCPRCRKRLHKRRNKKLMILLLVSFLVLLFVAAFAVGAILGAKRGASNNNNQSAATRATPTPDVRVQIWPSPAASTPIATPTPAIATPSKTVPPSPTDPPTPNFADELHRIDKKYDSVDYGITTASMLEVLGAQYKDYDTLLNEIYQYLKKTIPPAEFQSIEADEINWIKEKEERAQSAAAPYEGGSLGRLEYSSVLVDETRDRCYYLLSLIH